MPARFRLVAIASAVVSLDGPLADPGVSVTGPLTAAEFDARRREMGVDSTLSFSLILHQLE